MPGNNSDKRKEARKKWRQSPKGKAYMKEYAKTYKESGKYKICKRKYLESEKGKSTTKKYRRLKVRVDKEREYRKERIKNDLQYKLACRLRTRLNKAINGNFKGGSAVKDLGCTIDQLKLHLESQFQPGMNWNNWSYTGWHIDHIIPLSSFNLEDREEFLKASHYTNLQPLWAIDNIKKYNKL